MKDTKIKGYTSLNDPKPTKRNEKITGLVKNIIHCTKIKEDLNHDQALYITRLDDLVFFNNHLTPIELIIEVLDVKVDKEDELEKTNIVAQLLNRFDIKQLY